MAGYSNAPIIKCCPNILLSFNLCGFCPDLKDLIVMGLWKSLLQSILRIADNIQKDLLNLLTPCNNLWKVGRYIHRQFYAVFNYSPFYQTKYVGNDILDVSRTVLFFAIPGKSKQLFYNFRNTLRLFDNHIRNLCILALLITLTLQYLGNADNSGYGIIDLMSNTGCQLTQ